ncbi:mitochondrial ribosomal protein subunit L20-domain-containing protein [Gilbertella persicaria]|uniref:mitochondrial ribosomal protein subunit L20-domain-containing protein n=1 Tax=Gilbertella persicaria TaxID=101096 RepID=UPI00221F26B0|nr:mitochondrial ribosomal protein subunit L20-domain-containing protein [Gilbertella persicaria]KAI8047139.1 mitochondrial ribosomal protein subunit L20-domain-containing protein [Gilbertella persicaria]
MNRSILTSIRTYATKSKTTNLRYKPSVPVHETAFSDGFAFIERQPIVQPTTQAHVAPLLHKATPKQKLSEAEINELRQLRESDPISWTRSKLAKKFGCSELFISMAAPLKSPIAAKDQTASVAKHGYRRKLITQERENRRALW